MTGGGLSARLHGQLLAAWAQTRPNALARLLQPLSWVYGALAALHRAPYRLGWRQTARAPVPLLVVGNLVAGGAGKTPAVMAVVDLLRQQGWTPGVISRGHGRQGGEVRAVTREATAAAVGDEPLLIHLRTGVPVVVGADRAAAARALCAAHAAVDILVADDGLQHHRLHHDMALLVFDERGAGNGLLLPAGPLREALPTRPGPHQAVLYNAPRPSTALPGCTGTRRLAGVQPLAEWWAGRPLPDDGGWPALQALVASGTPLLAAAGLARPEPFFRMLAAQGLALTRLPLADHHPLQPLPWPASTPLLVLTEKDAVKLPPGTAGRTQVWVARLDFLPEPAFAGALRALCAPFKTTP
ncbi:tetraacyldisaccharide 4'-kinase [Pseudaquabacterium pictum]|uniref:Tetraacyldisaccharide 4'-kinase n=1 Tax=Pseudaquabacterium pictum TaxID=2315236 RepID=A0A480AL04_9BURK|nr:tetraacyldisaccharide 4'-kinase [Rubrivivax pictus]GCL62399.1 tetraacyldisaccharide 4'-kinase [Rubrivivax pictus]